MKSVAVVSVARSDYGIYRPVFQMLQQAEALDPYFVVGAAHLADQFGKTVREIEADGFPIRAKVEMTEDDDSPLSIDRSMSRGVQGFGAAFEDLRPDIVVVLGDRYEMFSAALACVPLRIPLAHIHGGELSYGAIDEVFRHGMTKLSHLHFASTEDHGRRIRQMGEEPWRVTVSGAPAIDAIHQFAPLSKDAFNQKFGFALPPRFVVATFHPVTLQWEEAERQCAACFEPLAEMGVPALITMPNADSGGLRIRDWLNEAAKSNPQWTLFENLGSLGYYSALKHASAVIGNSSSGIVEAASFGLPVLNVGERQSGRTKGSNIIDVAADASQVKAGLQKVLSDAFRAQCSECINPYGDGHASERISKVLVEADLGAKLIMKRFVDL